MNFYTLTKDFSTACEELKKALSVVSPLTVGDSSIIYM